MYRFAHCERRSLRLISEVSMRPHFCAHLGVRRCVLLLRMFCCQEDNGPPQSKSYQLHAHRSHAGQRAHLDVEIVYVPCRRGKEGVLGRMAHVWGYEERAYRVCIRKW